MKRIESLTFLRFIAASIVVIYHFGENTSLVNSLKPFINSGPQMVSLFFVLSGFVMIIAHFNRKNENVRDYYVSRIARIVPIYFLAIIFSVYVSRNFNWKAILLNLTFLQSWFSPFPLSINGPGWSLSVEAFFYLTFPLILFELRIRKINWKTLMVVAIFIYLFTQAILSNLLMNSFYTGFPSASHDLLYYFPLTHFCSFLLGISGGYLFLMHPEWFNRTGFLPFSIFIATLLLNYFCLQYPNLLSDFFGVPLAFASSFYSLVFLVLILGLTHSKSVFSRILSLPIFVVLGESSYSLYILQEPLNKFFNQHLVKRLSS